MEHHPFKNIILGINASRARSGGAKAHLIGILTEGNPSAYGFKEVHVWSYRELLDDLPDRPWLFKHCPSQTKQSLLRQIWWEKTVLTNELKANSCDILLNVDAGHFCKFHPNVTMSRDMLSYEAGEINRYGWSKARLRLIFLKYVQNRSLKQADGVVFLTRYASKVIQQSCGSIRRLTFIPHGIGKNFHDIKRTLSWPNDGGRPIRLLYISNTDWYKHQWMVVRATELLRMLNIDVILTLIGGGNGPSQQRLTEQIALSDPRGEFVSQKEFIPHASLPGYLAEADIFVFASSCENMPNTLVEAMAAGLPIACSGRGPMPEVLEDGGEYFDPEIPETIANALRKLIEDSGLRQRVSLRAKTLASRYSWERCASETWTFLVQTYKYTRA